MSLADNASARVFEFAIPQRRFRINERHITNASDALFRLDEIEADERQPMDRHLQLRQPPTKNERWSHVPHNSERRVIANSDLAGGGPSFEKSQRDLVVIPAAAYLDNFFSSEVKHFHFR